MFSCGREMPCLLTRKIIKQKGERRLPEQAGGSRRGHSTRQRRMNTKMHGIIKKLMRGAAPSSAHPMAATRREASEKRPIPSRRTLHGYRSPDITIWTHRGLTGRLLDGFLTVLAVSASQSCRETRKAHAARVSPKRLSSDSFFAKGTNTSGNCPRAHSVQPSDHDDDLQRGMG